MVVRPDGLGPDTVVLLVWGHGDQNHPPRAARQMNPTLKGAGFNLPRGFPISSQNELISEILYKILPNVKFPPKLTHEIPYHQ
jgi:hypothetical protein